MTENSIELSFIFIPSCHEPSEEFALASRDIQTFFKKMNIRYEILQTRRLSDVVEKLHGQFIFVLASDLKVPLAEVISFLAYFHQHPKISGLIGDRFTEKKKLISTESKLHRSFRRLNQYILNRLFKIDSKDVFCPFTALRRESALKIFQEIRAPELLNLELFLRFSEDKLKQLSVRSSGQQLECFHDLTNLPRLISLCFAVLRLKLQARHLKIK